MTSYRALRSSQAPVYATLPVAKMSQLLMYSQRAAQRELSDTPPFSGEDIDAACELFRPLRYQQLVTLAGVRLITTGRLGPAWLPGLGRLAVVED